jgi:RimJ/RimL family protein N-acetyltransferase
VSVALREPEWRDRRRIAGAVDDVVISAMGWGPVHAKGIRRLGYNLEQAIVGGYLVVVNQSDDKTVGMVQLHTFDRSEATCELGCWFGADARGRGFGTEAVRLALAEASRRGFRSVVICTQASNVAMQRVAQKVGAWSVPSDPHRLPDGTVIKAVCFEASTVVPLR